MSIEEEYPEHKKVNEIPRWVRQRIGDWLESVIIAEWGCPHGVTRMIADSAEGWDCEESVYCRRGENEARLWKVRRSAAEHIAEIFDIDYQRFMQEKDRMFEELQEEAEWHEQR